MEKAFFNTTQKKKKPSEAKTTLSPHSAQDPEKVGRALLMSP
jgi:hypothetical protein